VFTIFDNNIGNENSGVTGTILNTKLINNILLIDTFFGIIATGI
jgi:hypothetical protein